jgi:hypothetical protein
MAKLEPMGIVGRIDNVIHYRIGNQYYARSAPRKFKQTKATKARAGQFGQASRIGSTIRGQLFPVLAEPSDRKMQGRLVAVLFEWLHSSWGQRAEKCSVGNIVGFSFIEKSRSVRERWKTTFQVNNPSSGRVELKIPAFVPEESIKAPTGTCSVICKIATGVCDVSTGSALGNFSTELVFDYNNNLIAEQTISMRLPTPKGSLIVTGISLEYRISRKTYIAANTNKAYMPAGIVDAKYTGS